MRKQIALLLAAVMALSLCACGEQKAPDAAATAANTTVDGLRR